MVVRKVRYILCGGGKAREGEGLFVHTNTHTHPHTHTPPTPPHTLQRVVVTRGPHDVEEGGKGIEELELHPLAHLVLGSGLGLG